MYGRNQMNRERTLQKRRPDSKDMFGFFFHHQSLIFSVVAIRSAVASRSISKWPFRTLLLYFALFAFLILGGTLMLVARRHGY